MKRSLVILPNSFSGPWCFGFGNPLPVYGPAGEKFLAVLVTDSLVSIPAEGVVFEMGPLCTVNSVLARASLTRTKPPAPPPPEPEPVVVVVAPSPEPETVTDSVAAAEPVVIVMPPVEEAQPVRKPPSLFQRVKNFFKPGS